MPACRRCLGFALLLPLATAVAEPIRVTGTVLSLEKRWSGKPGALVELFPAYEDSATALRRLKEKTGPAPLASTRTRADGSFEITAPETGGFRVTVRTDGYLPIEVPFLPLLADTALPPASLYPGQPLEARTVGQDGQPLAGIEVQLGDPAARWTREQEEEPLSWRTAERKGISGSDGRLTLPVYEAESPVLIATSAAFLGQTMQSPPGWPATHRLSSRQAVTIEVQDREGNPVPDALIRWRGQAIAATGPDGRCSIAIPSGEPLLAVSAQGWSARIVRPVEGAAGVVSIRLQPPQPTRGPPPTL